MTSSEIVQERITVSQTEEKLSRQAEAAHTQNSTGVELGNAKLELKIPSDGGGSAPSLKAAVKYPPPKGSSFSPLVCVHVADPMADLNPAHYRTASWSYPSTELEVIRYKVFVDLWSRSYYITPGLKYGGDYLVYSGDPALVHSHYVAIVQPWSQAVNPLVTCGRIGTKVKKNTLLCSVDLQGTVRYFTWQWTGIA